MPGNVHLKKSLIAVVASGLFALSAVVGPANAVLPTSDSPSIDLDAIREHMTEAEVSPEVQDSLIAKLLRGETFDSMTGVAPVTTEVVEEDGYERTIHTFADGSYQINSVQIPTPLPSGGIGARSVSGCVNGAGAGRFPFWGCHVETSQALFAIDFYMDGYKGSSGGWYGSITNVYDIGYWTGAATVNSTSLTIVKANQNASGPAYARATLFVTFLLGSGSGTYKLTGYVDYGSTYDTSP